MHAADAPKPNRTVRITAERYTYSPSRITVKQGDVVEFIVSSDDTDHGFKIPSAGVDAAIPQAGKGELRVVFIAREKGKFAFECSRPCGAGHNLMRGEIVVR
jgi:cytochrome c oxidase subunit 2